METQAPAFFHMASMGYDHYRLQATAGRSSSTGSGVGQGMTPRLIDLVFRRKLLLAIPVMLGILLGFAWLVLLKPRPVYYAQASVWVDRPSSINGGYAGSSLLLSDITSFNQYASPASNQTGTLLEL